MPIRTSSDDFRYYPFTFVQNLPKEGDECWNHRKLYHFKSPKSKQWYLVWVDVYDHHMYGIKFHLKSDRDSKSKYHRLTGLNEVRPLINTCIAIMLEINEADNLSSFGFVGANLIGENEYETKRYRVYRRIMLTYFSEDFFKHVQSKEKSAYMLIRKSQIEVNPNLLDELSGMFSDYYEYFD